MIGQGSNFREIGNFQLSKSISQIGSIIAEKRNYQQHIPYSILNRVTYRVNRVFQYFDGIILMYNIPEGNNVTHTGKNCMWQTESIALIYITNGQESL